MVPSHDSSATKKEKVWELLQKCIFTDIPTGEMEMGEQSESLANGLFILSRNNNNQNFTSYEIFESHADTYSISRNPCHVMSNG